MSKFFQLAVLLFLAGRLYAAGEDALVFRAGFDGSVNPEKAAQGTIVELAGNAQFQEGRKGQALLADGAVAVYYSTMGNLLPKEGSFEFWVKPVDWDGSDPRFHVFFNSRYNEGWMMLYKYVTKNSPYRLIFDDPLRNPVIQSVPSAVTTPSMQLIKMEWNHLAATWKDGVAHLYMNGTPVIGVGPLKKLGAKFLIGDVATLDMNKKLSKPDRHTLIDELKLYNRALSRTEVLLNYWGTQPNANLMVQLAPTRAKGTATLVQQGYDNAIFELLSGDGKKALLTKKLKFAGNEVKEEFSLSELPEGNYIVRFQCFKDGKAEPVMKQYCFTKPSAHWLGNKIGLGDKVPAPWTSIAVESSANGVVMRCWGRSFTFADGSPFPSGLESAGAKLLNTPIKLTGVDIRWNPSAWKIVKANQATVEFSASGVFSGGSIKVAGILEFDGFLWYQADVSLDGNKASVPGSLALIMTMPMAHAIFRAITPAVNSNSVSTNGTLAGWKTYVPYSPLFWLGDDERGLTFLSENNTWWTGDQRSSFYLENTGGALACRINLLADGLINNHTHLEFGLQPTPMRPRPANWRIGGSIYPRLQYLMDNSSRRVNIPADCVLPEEPVLPGLFSLQWTSKANRFQGYPEYVPGVEADSIRVSVKKKHDAGRLVIPYIQSVVLDDASPEWSYFKDEWYNPGNQGNGFDWEGRKGTLESIVADSSWQDFIVWKSRDFLIKEGFDGLYHDYYSERITNRSDSPVGAGLPLLAYRSLNKRLYIMLSELGKQKIRIGHTSFHSGGCIPSSFSFLDYFTANEQIAAFAVAAYGKKAKDKYWFDIPLEYWRVNFASKAFGPIPFVLFLDAWHPGVMGMLLLHDIHGSWPCWQNLKQSIFIYELDKKMAAFGIGDPALKFIPYWDNSKYVSLTGKDSLCSLYYIGGKKALAVIVNRSGKAEVCKLTFRSEACGLTSKLKAYDLLSGEVLKLDGNVLNINVAEYDFKLVCVEPEN